MLNNLSPDTDSSSSEGQTVTRSPRQEKTIKSHCENSSILKTSLQHDICGSLTCEQEEIRTQSSVLITLTHLCVSETLPVCFKRGTLRVGYQTVKGGEKMKNKILFTTLISALAVSLLLIANAHAYYTSTTPIQSLTRSVSAQYSPYLSEIDANITSWYEIEILPQHTYQWEWITFNPATVNCSTSGDISITFQSYITVQSFSLSLSGANYTWSESDGGSSLQINMTGTGSGPFSLRTNYIPSNYWGQITNITISATAGVSNNNSTFGLQI
jgi:hypothetical protein